MFTWPHYLTNLFVLWICMHMYTSDLLLVGTLCTMCVSVCVWMCGPYYSCRLILIVTLLTKKKDYFLAWLSSPRVLQACVRNPSCTPNTVRNSCFSGNIYRLSLGKSAALTAAQNGSDVSGAVTDARVHNSVNGISQDVMFLYNVLNRWVEGF